MANANIYQGFVKVEKKAGTPDYGVGKDALEATEAVALVQRPTVQDSTTFTEVPGSSGNLTPEAALAGLTTSQITHNALLRHHSKGPNVAMDIDAVPEIDPYLRSAAFAARQFVAFQVASGTPLRDGTFLHGEPLLSTYPTGSGRALAKDPTSITGVTVVSGKVHLAIVHGFPAATSINAVVHGISSSKPGERRVNGFRTLKYVDANTLEIANITVTGDTADFSAAGNAAAHWVNYVAAGNGTKARDQVAPAAGEILSCDSWTPGGGAELPETGCLIVGVYSGAYAQVADYQKGGSGATQILHTRGQVYRPTSKQTLRASIAAVFPNGLAAGDIVRSLENNRAFARITSVDGNGLGFEFEPTLGDLANGMNLVTVTEDANGNRVIDSANVAVINAEIEAAGSPPATYESRVGGELVGLNGAKTNFTVGLTSAENALFDAVGQGAAQRARTKSVEPGVLSTTQGGLQFLEAKFRFRDYGTDGSLAQGGGNPASDELDDTQYEDLEFCVNNAQIQSGNTIALTQCHEAKGIKSATITGRAITLTATVEATDPIVKPWREVAKRGGTVEVYIEIGQVDGNRVYMHIPKLQVRQVADAEQDALKQITITGTAIKASVGDDEFAVFFE